MVVLFLRVWVRVCVFTFVSACVRVTLTLFLPPWAIIALYINKVVDIFDGGGECHLSFVIY